MILSRKNLPEKECQEPFPETVFGTFLSPSSSPATADMEVGRAELRSIKPVVYALAGMVALTVVLARDPARSAELPPGVDLGITMDRYRAGDGPVVDERIQKEMRELAGWIGRRGFRQRFGEFRRRNGTGVLERVRFPEEFTDEQRAFFVMLDGSEQKIYSKEMDDSLEADLIGGELYEEPAKAMQFATETAARHRIFDAMTPAAAQRHIDEIVDVVRVDIGPPDGAPSGRSGAANEREEVVKALRLFEFARRSTVAKILAQEGYLPLPKPVTVRFQWSGKASIRIDFPPALWNREDIPTLRQWIESGNAHYCDAARKALDTIERSPEENLDTILGKLKSRDLTTVFRALERLKATKYEDPRKSAELKALKLDEGTDDLMKLIQRSSIESKYPSDALPPSAAPALIAAFGVDNYWVREAAIRQIHRIGAPAVPELEKALGDRRRHVQAGAAMALGEVGNESSIKVMEQVFTTFEEPRVLSQEAKRQFLFERVIGDALNRIEERLFVTKMKRLLPLGVSNQEALEEINAYKKKRFHLAKTDVEPLIPSLVQQIRRRRFVAKGLYDVVEALGESAYALLKEELIARQKEYFDLARQVETQQKKESESHANQLRWYASPHLGNLEFAWAQAAETIEPLSILIGNLDVSVRKQGWNWEPFSFAAEQELIMEKFRIREALRERKYKRGELSHGGSHYVGGWWGETLRDEELAELSREALKIKGEKKSYQIVVTPVLDENTGNVIMKVKVLPSDRLSDD